MTFAFRDSPLAWAIVAFATYFWYAQFVLTLGWNTVELIIAQHVIDHGTFAASLDYRSAITWRPVLPTLLVAFVRLFTANPLLIYQILCASALAILASCLFWAARRVWGNAAAHVAAFLTVACPAITTNLLNNVQGLSHVGALVFLGLAILMAVVVLHRRDDQPAAPSWVYAFAGLCWGLAYLCRTEMLLFVVLHLGALAWLHWGRKFGAARILVQAAVFLVVFVPYNFYANHVAERDGLLLRKPIYHFYLSQVWVDPPPTRTTDAEIAGYAYARELYGDPLENNESLLTAIRHNPAAFVKRVRINAAEFYRHYADATFFPPWWSVASLLMAVLACTRLVSTAERRTVLFLFGLFLASHFIWIFHIDLRYLAINIPALLLLAAGFFGAVLERLRRARSPVGVGLAIAAAAFLVLASRGQLARLRAHGPRDDRGVVAMRSLGEYFLKTVRHPSLGANREPHIAFQFPDPLPIRWEDMFLLGYFTHTAWYMHFDESQMPMGRFYTVRDCEDDYLFLPAARATGADPVPGMRMVGETDNPVLGRYALFERVRAK